MRDLYVTGWIVEGPGVIQWMTTRPASLFFNKFLYYTDHEIDWLGKQLFRERTLFLYIGCISYHPLRSTFLFHEDYSKYKELRDNSLEYLGVDCFVKREVTYRYLTNHKNMVIRYDDMTPYLYTMEDP